MKLYISDQMASNETPGFNKDRRARTKITSSTLITPSFPREYHWKDGHKKRWLSSTITLDICYIRVGTSSNER